MVRRPPRSTPRCSNGASCPATHIVDTGFLDAELLVESQDHYGVDLLGPTRLDYHWQAREGAGFDAQHFPIDWDRQHATCPAGKTSTGWTPAVDNRGNPVIKVKFSTKDCRRCDQIAHCIRSTKRYPRRTLTIRPQPQYQALQAARQREATERFRRSMRAAPGSKAPFHEGYGAHACDAPAISAWRGCISDTS